MTLIEINNIPAPPEYKRPSAQFYDYLLDARDTADLWSTRATYTMTQGAFQVFRRRLSTEEAVAFANVLPIFLRALFVTDWDTNVEKKSFEDRESMTREVRMLRINHNFSTDTAIRDVAQALRRHVDEARLDNGASLPTV